jgi:hypothetical protein
VEAALKSINTLIKLHKRQMDVLRREMLTLEEERRQMHLLSDTLTAEHANERQLAAQDPMIAPFFGAYSRRVMERLTAIAEEVKRLDAAVEAKIEAVRAEFSEQKKYDIARGHIHRRMASEALRKQQQRFDEIAAQQYSARLEDKSL